MGFRIDKGVFQFKDGDRFINKFKIDEAGTMVEVDPETGDPVAAYMRVGDKATDSDLLDGINSSSFLRNAGGTYTLGSGVHFSLKHTTSTGYSEMSLANNSNHRLVMGSIGSGYTNSAWAGSRYIYSTDGELRIKAATQLRLYSGGMSHTGNLAVTFDTSQNATFEGNTYFKGVLGNDLRINRHIDGSRGWSGGSAEMFLGWYSDKLVIGNNDHGGHDFALSAPLDSVVMTNPTYYHKSIGLGKNTVIPYAEWGATNASQGFVVIEFPVTAYAMINADIGVYEYNGYNGSNILVGGHPWNGGWYNYGSKTLGELGKQIRFAYTAAGKYAIVIGMPDTTWTYGQVQLKRIQNGTYYDGRVSANGDYSIYQSQDEGIFAWISDDTSRSIDVNRAAQADNAETLDGIDSGAFLRSNTDDDVTGNTEWQDNKQIRLGNSADFRMWHDGSHTYFRNYNHGNGNIYFQGEDTAGANHALLYMFTANTRPYVSLYEDGAERFKTTSAGVEVLGDAYINQGRIHIKRGTGLTHTEWEDDSSANGRAQLILDSHYSDLIIASRNANTNKHGSTLTFATQSTSTNDVAKWVIGQGQYQEGANILAFAYGTNQTNPHSILGTDNAAAEMTLTNGVGLNIANKVYANGGDSSKWQTAYEWGNHASEGYFKSTTRSFTVEGDPETWYPVRFRLYTMHQTFVFRKHVHNSGTWDGDLSAVFVGWSSTWGGDNGYLKPVHIISQTQDFIGKYRQSSGPNDYAVFWFKGGGRTYNYQTYPAYVNAEVFLDRVDMGSNGVVAPEQGLSMDDVQFDTALNEARTAQTTANNAETAAINAQNTADSAETRANSAREEAVAAGEAALAAQATADSKLGATAKAADSNLLDGIDSSSFVQTTGSQSITGTKKFSNSSLVIEGSHATISFIDNTSSADDFYIHVNSNNFYVLRDTAGANVVDGGYDTPHPLELQGDTNKAYIFGNLIGSAAYASTSNFETAGAADAAKEELIPLITTAQTTADNAATAAAAAQSTANTAETRANSAREEAGAAYALADGKLGATAKAADANKLDGYDWMQSGKNIRATEFYADNWFRNYNSNEGMYNQATGQHWYSDDDDYWNVAGGSAANGIRFRDEHGGTIRGYVYANNSNQVGILDAGGSWAIRHTNDSATEFYDADERVFSIGQGGHGSNYGTVCTHGNGRGGWEGYSINERFVWMSSDTTLCGMYNDMDNEWMTQYHRNGAVKLYHNGGLRLETQSGGAKVHGTMTATVFSGSGANLTNLPVPDQSIPVSLNGQGGLTITSINFNLDRGIIEYTLSSGEIMQGALAR